MPKRIKDSFDKICKFHGITSHYLTSENKERCRACRNLAVVKRRKILKLKAIEYKGGVCSRCSYSSCVEAMEFHHLNPSEKDFGIGKIGTKKSWSSLVKELDKCILVCANCHRELHAEIMSGPKYELKHEPRLNQVERAKLPRTIKKQCNFCNIEYSDTPSEMEDRMFCSSVCHNLSRRKVARPTSEELNKLLWETSTRQIAKRYGVSDKTIEKWAKFYNLSKPPRGYWSKQKSINQTISNSD
jgi:ribosomal protein L35